MQSINTYPSLCDLLDKRAAQHPNKKAFIYLSDGEKDELPITFSELQQKAKALAAEMQGLGATKGQVALLLFPPGLDFIIGLFACLYAGVVAVPAYSPDPRRLKKSMARLESMIADTQPHFILTVPTLYHLRTALKVFVSGLRSPHWLNTNVKAADAKNFKPVAIGKSDLAYLQFTSGTTSAPRGAKISHKNVLANLQIINESFMLTPDKVVVTWVPFYHDLGLLGILYALGVGMTEVFISPQHFLEDPFRWLRAISKYKGAIGTGPNFAYDLLAHRYTAEQAAGLDLKSWEYTCVAAEPVRADTLEKFYERFKAHGFRWKTFAPLYGLAESTGVVTCVSPRAGPVVERIDKNTFKAGFAEPLREGGMKMVSSGSAKTDHEAAVVDPETLRTNPEGKIGEIWLRGPCIPEGYWGHDEDTKEIFNQFPKDLEEELETKEPRPSGYLRTGDLGYIRNGEVFVTGRLKELIIVRGANFAPSEVEAVVADAHEGIRGGQVNAFQVDDGLVSELIIVAETRSNKESDWKNQVDVIRSRLSEELELDVDHILLVEPRTIPKTMSGKLQRAECRKLFLAGQLKKLYESKKAAGTPSSFPPNTELEHWLKMLIAEKVRLSPGEIANDKPFTDLGLDSINAVEITGLIEKRVGKKLPSQLLWTYPNLNALVKHLKTLG